MKCVEIADVREIGRILDYVHDRKFQLSDINYDQNSCVLLIPLTVPVDLVIDHTKYFIFHLWKNPIIKADLIVNNVKAYEIIDDAKIGEGIINTIISENNIVRIICSVPVLIEAEILEFSIALKFSNITVEKVSRFSFRPPLPRPRG